MYDLLLLSDREIEEAVSPRFVTVVSGSRKAFNLRNRKLLRSAQLIDKKSEFRGGGRDDSDETNALPTHSSFVQTDELEEEEMAKYTLSPAQILAQSERIVSTVPRDISYPYHRDPHKPVKGIFGRRTKRLFSSMTSSAFEDDSISVVDDDSDNWISESVQTLVKGPDIFPIFKVTHSGITQREKLGLGEIPYVRSDDWPTVDSMKDDPKEKDNEWLKFSTTEIIRITDNKKKELKNIYSKNLIAALHPLVQMMRFTGRWPFFIKLTKGEPAHIFLNRKSKDFIYFSLTSLFQIFSLGITFLNIADFLWVAKETQTFYSNVEKLEFDKYWPYLFWNLLLAIFTCYWNLFAIFDGHFLAQYMTRWNDTVCKIKYYPTEGVKIRIYLWLASFISYSTFLIICFITEFVPAVFYGSGLITTFLLRGFAPRVRFVRYFILLRILGLFYHLYTYFSFGIIILHLVIHCKLLENMAKKWNIRFAYRFDIIKERELMRRKYGVPICENKEIKNFSKITLLQILTEHKVITAYSRYTSAVFFYTMNLYLFTSGLIIGLFIYRAISYALDVDSETPYVPRYLDGKIGETGEIILLEDSDIMRTTTLVALTSFLFISWFINCESFVRSGRAIMNGYEYARRYGLVRCKSAKERMLIKSLSFEFAPSIDYYLHFGFKFNREALFNIAMYIILFGIGLSSFSPFKLNSQQLTSCEEESFTGETICKTVQVSRVSLGTKESVGAVGKSIEQQNAILAQVPFANIDKKATLGGARIPAIKPKVDFCTETWNGVKITNTFTIPPACDGRTGAQLLPYGRRNQFRCLAIFPNEVNDLWPYTQNSFLNLIRCGQFLNPPGVTLERDDCGNINTFGKRQGRVAQAIANLFGEKIFQRKLVELKINSSGVVNNYRACCWDFGDAESLSRCNMRSSDLAYQACVFGNAGGGSALRVIPGHNKVNCDERIVQTVKRKDRCSATLHINETAAYKIEVYNFASCFSLGSEIMSRPFFDKNGERHDCYNENTQPIPFADPEYLGGTKYLNTCDGRGQIVPASKEYRDDCGNLPFHGTLTKVLKHVNFFEIVDGKWKSSGFKYLCCYDYTYAVPEFILKLSVDFCNMQSNEQMNAACKGSDKIKTCT